MAGKVQGCGPLARMLLVGVATFGCATMGFAATLEQSQWDAVGKAMLVAADHERSAQQAPSIAIGLVDRNGLKWSGAVGYADADGKHAADARTVYRIGSISKLFTDLMVMQLVQRGELDLDAPVSRYLPDFAPRNPFGGAITLRQLTSHRSGLVREPPRGNYFDTSATSLEATVRSLNSTTLVAAPGTLTKYSNAGIAVLGRVLEVVTRKPFDQLIQTALLQPLAMSDSAPRATPAVRSKLAHAQLVPFDASRFTAPLFDLGMAPAGNLYSSVTDLSKFATALLNGGAAAKGRILEAATLQRMWEPQHDADANRRFGIGFALGSLDGHRMIGHSGAVYGYVADLALFPDDGFAVIVMVALDEAVPSMNRLRAYAARQVWAAQAAAAKPQYLTSDAVPRELAQKIAGHFSDGNDSVDIRVLNERVYLESASVAAELRRAGERWVLDDVTTFSDEVGIDAQANEVTLGGKKYRRATPVKPPLPSEELASLIGEYGWEHNSLRVYERAGEPYVRIEWSHYEPLERVAKDVYRFKNPQSLYAREELRFERSANGQGSRANLNGIVFERRDFGAELEQHIRSSVAVAKDLRTQALAARPPVETGKKPADLVDLTTVDPGFHLDVRYASTNNFMGVPFYESPRAFLQRPAAQALARANRRLAQQGYGIAVHDAYRPWYVTKMFWDATPANGKDFVADPSKGSMHNRGCAADITMYDSSSGRIVQMPGRYDEMSARSSPIFVGGTSFERWQRDVLKAAVEAEGFDVYVYEWWHFDYHTWRDYPILNVDFKDIRAAE
jgi:CubicO group peptidase (beta-lactamase class C family)/D-alanyl-D-alanine dipeptidase